MTSNVCEAWATCEDVTLSGCADCPEDFDCYLMTDLLLAASSMLNRKVGYLWPGLCSEYVRPCSQFGGTGAPAWHGLAWDWWPSWWSWFPAWGVCGCERGLSSRACSCCGPAEIMLGAELIASVTEVKIDGVVLAPTAYEIHDDAYLVRTDGGSWPCCQRVDLPDTEEDTFSVSYVAGADPPIEAKRAAIAWACQMYQSCTPGGSCSIPVEVVGMVRENVDYDFRVVNIQELQAGFVGNVVVDQFLAVYLETEPTIGADIWSPDVQAAVRRPRV